MKNGEAIAVALRAIADTVETLAVPAPDPTTVSRVLPVFVTRKQAKELLSLETKAFNRAGEELTFLKPGRELLLPTQRLIAWVEAQPVKRAELPANDDTPIDFAEFRAAVQKRAAR